MKRVSSVAKFAFHVHEFVLILCILCKLSIKRLFVTAGSDDISMASLKTSLYFQKYKRMGWAGITQSIYRLATGKTVRGWNPCGSEIFRTRSDQPCGLSFLLYNGYRVFPRGKAAGAWRWLPTSSSVEVKERVELHLYSSYGPFLHVLGWILPAPFAREWVKTSDHSH
jgi:hypothetical protein